MSAQCANYKLIDNKRQTKYILTSAQRANYKLIDNKRQTKYIIKKPMIDSNLFHLCGTNAPNMEGIIHGGFHYMVVSII